MGVTGAGKTTVGLALAARLGWRFADADDFHSAANVEKMRAGMPLTDSDREAWLDALAGVVAECERRGESLVLACSALKQRYRERLHAATPAVLFVYLRISRELAGTRVRDRQGHFMPKTLVGSQFEALEEPVVGLTVDGSQPVEEVVSRVVEWLGGLPGPAERD